MNATPNPPQPGGTPKTPPSLHRRILYLAGEVVGVTAVAIIAFRSPAAAGAIAAILAYIAVRRRR